jgi:hypothetical protein
MCSNEPFAMGIIGPGVGGGPGLGGFRCLTGLGLVLAFAPVLLAFTPPEAFRVLGRFFAGMDTTLQKNE